MTYFYRRSLELRSDAKSSVVYALLLTDGKPDPVPGVAGMLPGWCATENPGQCLACDRSNVGNFVSAVPRSQFRHYKRISDAEALALYPDLLG